LTEIAPAGAAPARHSKPSAMMAPQRSKHACSEAMAAM
jgi:hypothetical protein